MKTKCFTLDFMNKKYVAVHYRKRLGHFHHYVQIFMKKNNLAKSFSQLKELFE